MVSECESAPPALLGQPIERGKKKDEWKPLFDGQSLNGWRRFGKNEPPGPGWRAEDGILKLQAGGQGGDIISLAQFDNFDLSWEWRLAPQANNGIKYLVTESRPTAPGPEYQMVDNSTMPAAKHRTASLYEIIAAPADAPVKPAGEWNQSRLLIQGKQVEHWLNGQKVVAYALESAELQAAIAQSKFKNAPGFGQKIKGHILLTDHRDEAWYRNIKIRELPGK